MFHNLQDGRKQKMARFVAGVGGKEEFRIRGQNDHDYLEAQSEIM